MKNTLKFLGIIAFTAIIGFSMLSCDMLFPSEEEETPGKLTLTGFDNQYNGYFVCATWDNGTRVWAASYDKNSDTYIQGKVVNNQVVLNMYDFTNNPSKSMSAGVKTDIYLNFRNPAYYEEKVKKSEFSKYEVPKYIFSATFTDGNAAHVVGSTGSWAGSINYLP